MNERQALFQAVLDAPDDDAPRLVLADWLDEHDEGERAEFIRAQVEVERLDEFDPSRTALLARAEELFGRHRLDWQKGLPGWAVDNCKFRRGFADEVVTTAGRWLRSGGALRRGAPVRMVRLGNPRRRYAALFACPTLAGLRGLHLEGRMDLRALRALVASPHLGSLTTLIVGGVGWSLEGARVLAGWPGLAQLRALSVTSAALDDAGCSVLAGSPAVAGLAELRLKGCDLGDAAYHALASSPHLRRLRVLDLHWNIPHQAVAALLDSQLAEGLEELRLSMNGLHTTGLPPLTRLANVRKLDLSENGLGDEAAERLADAPPPRLRVLELSVNAITDRGALALARSPHLEGLRLLRLRFNYSFTRAADALRQRFGERVEL
jgi:uncharacterized protein (TIGR02996 family)